MLLEMESMRKYRTKLSGISYVNSKCMIPFV